MLVDSTSDYDYDNAAAVEVYAVDGNLTPTAIYGGKLGPLGDSRNVHIPLVSGVGRTITFRVHGVGPDLSVAAVGIVFYE
jgi:hypothetical protein